ncbi:MAG TPA: pseudouridine synthase [Candidatus Acidoferrales bacterium]|nr:pseudouridine synthase [Candidatus Acidoferrales bacterium]
MLERLQKIISRAGIASRRHAEQLILSGQVRVNGLVITELGSKADPETDRIEAAGRRVVAEEEKVVLLLHKPPQVVSTMADPEGRRTLRNFLRGLPERVYPVGRLDYAASGLMLLTNDGELANRLLKTARTIPQTYWIKVKGRLDEALLERAKRETRADVRPLKQPTASRGRAENFWYEAVWSETRHDRLPRWLATQGHPVEKMRRMRLGPLEVESLPEGRYRRLTEPEVSALKQYLIRVTSLKEGRKGGSGRDRSAVSAGKSTKARFRPAAGGRGIQRF